ncbi:MAG: hypothetical protein ACOCP4_04740 [Candidatus Woesearchaeota archaeon]
MNKLFERIIYIMTEWNILSSHGNRKVDCIDYTLNKIMEETEYKYNAFALETIISCIWELSDN